MASKVESASAETEVTILFADVVGSTHLYEAMGDDLARETIQQCVEIMRQATDQYGGVVIKTMGDEVMSTFPSADDAMNAGSRMQHRITNNSKLGIDGTRVSIRIGCHFGSVVMEDKDIFGAAVHTANRMTSQAKAGQIMTTSVTVQQLSSEWKALVREIDNAKFGGSGDEAAVYEVLWQPDEGTGRSVPANFVTTEKMAGLNLHLKFGDQDVVVGDAFNVNVTLGRANENDVVVKGKLISRVHARIELKQSRFLLTDQSTNGTFVQRDDGEESYVRRDTVELSGSGTIGLGRAAERGSDLAVEYHFEN